MSASATDHEGSFEASFLDMITNCVGILIVLVMVVGQRAKDAPAVLATKLAEDQQAQHDEARLAHQQTLASLREVQRKRAALLHEQDARLASRDKLGVLAAALERQIDEHRGELNSKSQERYDLARDLSLARAELARIETLHDQMPATQPAKTIEIESYPTPLSRELAGKSVAFHVANGRVAWIPIDALLERCVGALREKMQRLDMPPEAEGTVGPIDGFRMRYQARRHYKPEGVAIVLAPFLLVPESSSIGEPLELALRPGSQFLSRLDTLSPHLYSVVIFLYPECFEDLHPVKKELRDRGYPVAIWPKAAGELIGISPDGKRPVVQ